MRVEDLTITCRSFGPGQPIPHEHAVEGDDAMPVLDIAGVPADAVELAVICHDPDAPRPNGFTHWAAYGLAPSTATVGEVEPSRQGPNGLGRNGYTGPNPPPGHGPHHYYFWVYALDTAVDGTPSREEFLTRYAANVLEQNRVVGTYER